MNIVVYLSVIKSIKAFSKSYFQADVSEIM